MEDVEKKKREKCKPRCRCVSNCIQKHVKCMVDNSAPTVEIGENGNWIINGVDTGKSSKGSIGSVVTIGDNGNWFIDGVDTGMRAQGATGEPGAQGAKGETGMDGLTPYIGSNGNWWIGGTDTGVSATPTSTTLNYPNAVTFPAAGSSFFPPATKAENEPTPGDPYIAPKNGVIFISAGSNQAHPVTINISVAGKIIISAVIPAQAGSSSTRNFTLPVSAGDNIILSATASRAEVIGWDAVSALRFVAYI